MTDHTTSQSKSTTTDKHPATIPAETGTEGAQPDALNTAMTPSFVMRMQRTVGNRSVQRMLKVTQHTSPGTISRHPDDPLLADVNKEKTKVLEARQRAEESTATRTTLDTSLREVNGSIVIIEQKIGAMSAEGWKKQARLVLVTANAAKDKISDLIKVQQKNADLLKVVTDIQSKMTSKFRNVLRGTETQVAALIADARAGLTKVANATEKSVIEEGKAAAIAARDKLNGAITKGFPKNVSDLEGDINTARASFDKISLRTVERTAGDSAMDALAGILKNVKEAQASAEAVATFATRAASHAETIATAKLNAITKAEEAKAAREKATELQTALEEAKKAAEEFERVLEEVKKKSVELLQVKTAAEKDLAAAQSVLASAEKAKADLRKTIAEGDVEPYMADGYLADADKAIDAAREAVASAEAAVLEATNQFNAGMLTQQGAQGDFDKANEKATDTKAIEAAKDAETKAKDAEGLVAGAQENATQTTLTETTANTTDIEEETALRELQRLATGQTQLNELLTYIPDKAELKDYLDFFEYAPLIGYLKSGEIGVVKLKAFYAAFKDTYLHDLPKDRHSTLLRNYDVATITTLDTELGDEKTKAWLNNAQYILNLRSYLDKLTTAKFCEWQKEFTVDEFRPFIEKLTADKVKTISPPYSVTEFKPYIADFTSDQLLDFFTEFTAAEFKAYATTMGYDILKDRVKVKKLSAAALKKYEAAWLRDFVGVDGATKNHLTAVPYFNNTSLQVSGGHDKDRFETFMNEVIHVPSGRTRGTWNTVSTNGDVIKVNYTVYKANGDVRGSGSKTLIDGLTGSIDTWADRATKALWAAIKAKTFDRTVAPFTVSAGGYTFSGFYNDANAAVDTFYPV